MNVTEETMMQTFTVIDGFRRISFEGSLLGKASSRRPNHWRWTELLLYRTKSGTYVLEKVGVSRVVHVAACPFVIENLPRFQEIFPGDDPEDNDRFHFCDPEAEEPCVPDGALYDFTALLIEADRHWAQISNTAPPVVSALMRRKDGVRWFPRLSSQLLAQASELDNPIRNAYLLADSVIA